MTYEETFERLLTDYVKKMAKCYENGCFEPDEDANDAYNDLYDFFLELRGDDFYEEKES